MSVVRRMDVRASHNRAMKNIFIVKSGGLGGVRRSKKFRSDFWS
jgi:hypothetical protein